MMLAKKANKQGPRSRSQIVMFIQESHLILMIEKHILERNMVIYKI